MTHQHGVKESGPRTRKSNQKHRRWLLWRDWAGLPARQPRVGHRLQPSTKRGTIACCPLDELGGLDRFVLIHSREGGEGRFLVPKLVVKLTPQILNHPW